MDISKKTVRKSLDGITWTKIYNDNEHEIIMQANKNADDAEVKKSAQNDSHKILAKCVIDVKNEDPQKPSGGSSPHIPI